MNRQEVQTILEVYRPGDEHSGPPAIAEALRYLQTDPDLARWFAGERRFDQTMSAAAQHMPVPLGLKANLLAARPAAAPVVPGAKIIRPPFWRVPIGQDWRSGLAAAAVFMLLLGIGYSALRPSTVPFVEFRRELIAQDWAGDPHLDFESSDPQRVQEWLAQHHPAHRFAMPAGLRDLRIHGCRIIERNGEKLPLLCLADGPKHMHLFVIPRGSLSDPPPLNAPDFEKCGVWKTVSWSDGDAAFVLTGVNYVNFVNKFRKAGRWTMSG